MINTFQTANLSEKIVLFGTTSILQPTASSSTIEHNLGYIPKAIVAYKESTYYTPLDADILDFSNGKIGARISFYLTKTLLVIEMTNASGYAWASGNYPFVYYLFDSKLNI